MEEHQRDNSYDIIEMQYISSDNYKDTSHHQLENKREDEMKQQKQNQPAESIAKAISQSCFTVESNSIQPPRNAILFQEFKKEIKSMSYSDKIKAFFSNATYNIKTFSKTSWKSVKINSKHRKARLFDQIFVFNQNNPDLANQNILKFHEKIIWFSYRNNFPLIKDVMNDSQSSSNDYGWGCMIRCSQMLLAETLKRHFINDYNFNYQLSQSDQEKEFFMRIIKLFLDCTGGCQLPDNQKQSQLDENKEQSSQEDDNNRYSLFGIQNICHSAILRQYQSNVKNWYTSIQVCVIFQEILEEKKYQLGSKFGLQIINFSDQIIFLKELESASGQSINQPNNILVMIHMKFGLNKFDLQFKEYMLDLMEIPNFVGALSGTETKGMYIIGQQENRLIVLDPHFIQESTEGERNLEKDYQTYFNKTPRSLSIDCLSSDISFGFFIDMSQKNPIDEFIDNIYNLNAKHSEPLLSVLNDRVDVQEIDEEEEEEEVGNISGKPISDILNKMYEQCEENQDQMEEDQKQIEPNEIQYKHEHYKQSVDSSQDKIQEQGITKLDFYISNGSTLSDVQSQNLEKSNIPEIDQNPLSAHRPVQQEHIQIDRQHLNTQQIQGSTKSAKKRIASDFEMIS